MINPYRSPLARSDIETTDANGKCPCCHTPITFWAGVKQKVPFRFNCDTCKSQFRVHVPYKRLIISAACFSSIVFVVVSYVGIGFFGPLFFISSAPLAVTAWLVLEKWTHDYIMRRGRFELMLKRKVN